MSNHAFLQDVKLTVYRPQILTEIVPILIRYYVSEWGHDREFRQRFSEEVQTYLGQLDKPENGVLCAWHGGKLVGAVAVDGSDACAQSGWMRWFIVSEAHRKSGLGRLLLDQAIDYGKFRGFSRMLLSTYKNKDPAVRIYDEGGFRLCEERDFSTSQTHITQLWYEKPL